MSWDPFRIILVRYYQQGFIDGLRYLAILSENHPTLFHLDSTTIDSQTTARLEKSVKTARYRRGDRQWTKNLYSLVKKWEGKTLDDRNCPYGAAFLRIYAFVLSPILIFFRILISNFSHKEVFLKRITSKMKHNHLGVLCNSGGIVGSQVVMRRRYLLLVKLLATEKRSHGRRSSVLKSQYVPW